MGDNKQRREKGTGNVYMRSNGKWVGRLNVGKKSNGSPAIKYFSGKSEAEVKRKIREYNKSGINGVNADKITVGAYLDNWLKVYKKDSLKKSSYDRLENTINHQIKPNIGMIQIQQIKSDDIQTMLSNLKDGGSSYSTIKKVYDCMNSVMRHALISGDIEKDPMLLVKMPSKAQFKNKEIRFFTPEEAKAIVEEAARTYSTGAPVYIYGEAYVLALNTGLRIGELIALERKDWDKENKTLHIQRTAQSVKKRDKDGNSKGYELIFNPTKTYSGDRIIPLNNSATEAIEKMCAKYPNSKYIVCNSKGNIVPPDHLTRTFYRMLKNIGIEQTGPHSLRHTFASFLFANGTDVKTVSQLLGHSSIQVTLNTYVHLINDPDKSAVATLDDFI